MNYIVLARKLRPTRFQDLIGQETVAQSLKNAVRTGRLAHAYLFAGARGVGKTSAARILTKAINCERPQDGEPCNECGSCTEIARDASPDVYEIDAASNRGIDSIRELRENTGYVPVRGGYKTYIIDEAHMLTMESFNALLKTLEEPPPHVKFILATTNPHKIPETILSRCQRFDFARVPAKALTDFLAEVTAREDIRISRPALETIARNAAGGVRDALTAVDQVVSFAGLEPSDEQVLRILGLGDQREVVALLEAILDRSLPAALETFAKIRERGQDLPILLEALIREIKDFSLYLSLAGESSHLADPLPESLAFYEARKESVTLDELQQIFYLFLEVEGQLKRSEFAQACFEMGMVKACRVRPLVGIGDLLAQAKALSGGMPASASEPSELSVHSVHSVHQEHPANSAAGDVPAGPPVQPAGEPPPEPAQPSAADREPSSRPEVRAGSPEVSANRDEADEAEGGPARPAESAQESAAPPTETGTETRTETDTESGLGPVEDSAGEGGTESLSTESSNADGLNSEEELSPESLPAALCDDPRWLSLVERAGGAGDYLGAKLRRMEVMEIAGDSIRVAFPDEAGALNEEDRSRLEPLLHEVFGPAFQLLPIDDTKKKARGTHTIAGRNRLEEQALQAARKAAAELDHTVRRLMSSFPKAKIVEVSLSEAPPPDRRDDV